MTYEHQVRLTATVIQRVCRVDWETAKLWACLMGVEAMQRVRSLYRINANAARKACKHRTASRGKRRDDIDKYIRAQVRRGKRGVGLRPTQAEVAYAGTQLRTHNAEDRSTVSDASVNLA